MNTPLEIVNIANLSGRPGCASSYVSDNLRWQYDCWGLFIKNATVYHIPALTQSPNIMKGITLKGNTHLTD